MTRRAAPLNSKQRAMDYHDVRLLLDLPAVRLLRAQNAPLTLGFLYEAFRKEHCTAIPEGQLRALLEAYLEERREAEPEVYPQGAADYLTAWCSDGQGFLRRYYGTGTDEPLYELTTGSEKALLWLESLREARFIGTESRLESVFAGIEEILKFASGDPGKRIEQLQREAAEIQAEIDCIRVTGQVTTFTPVQINERYARVLATARELLGDFRQVEDNFKRVSREIAQKHAQVGVTKGAIVEHLLDSHDALRSSEQGQSFFAFWELLLSPDRQAEFQGNAALAQRLEALDEDNRRNPLLRQFITHLLREGEKVVGSHQRMSTNLRRVLDTAHLAERRRLGELLQEIRQAAQGVRHPPPRFDTFFDVEDFPAVFASLSRPLWQAPPSTSGGGEVVEDEGVLGVDDLRRFCNLPQIRIQELRRNVNACLDRDYTVNLQQVLDVFPPRNGMMEVVGYLIIASDETRHFVGDDTDILEVPGSRRQLWRVPKVLFCKG